MLAFERDRTGGRDTPALRYWRRFMGASRINDGSLNEVSPTRMAHVADVERLVALYSNMKPKDAAAIMNDLDLEVMVTVLGTMPERNAAPILAALNPVRARAVSLILLERAKLPGDRRLDRIRLN